MEPLIRCVAINCLYVRIMTCWPSCFCEVKGYDILVFQGDADKPGYNGLPSDANTCSPPGRCGEREEAEAEAEEEEEEEELLVVRVSLFSLPF